MAGTSTREVMTAMAGEGVLVAPRIARGCRCFAAWLDSRAVAYGWLSSAPEWIGELALEIRPGPGEAYIWNCLTLPEHRRRGLFGGLLLHLRSVALQEGLSRLWIGTVDGVADSVVAGAGFSPVLRFRAVTLGRLRWLQIRPARGAVREAVADALGSLAGGVRGGSRLQRVRARRH